MACGAGDPQWCVSLDSRQRLGGGVACTVTEMMLNLGNNLPGRDPRCPYRQFLGVYAGPYQLTYEYCICILHEYGLAGYRVLDPLFEAILHLCDYQRFVDRTIASMEAHKG